MPKIKLEKRFPNVSTEDFCEIYNRGWENGYRYGNKHKIPTDYIWQRAEWYEKQWLEDDNHWAKNVAEALRALLEDWDGEQGGGILWVLNENS